MVFFLWVRASIPFNWKFLIFVIIWWLIKNLFIYIECIVQTVAVAVTAAAAAAAAILHCRCRRRHSGRSTFSSLSFSNSECSLYGIASTYLRSAVLRHRALKKDIFFFFFFKFIQFLFTFDARRTQTHASNWNYIYSRMLISSAYMLAAHQMKRCALRSACKQL